MTDRFKFRAWDRLKRRMLWRNFFDRQWYDTAQHDESHVGHWVSVAMLEDAQKMILMQCTGLKDKNGVLIFDHDYILTDLNERRPYYRSDFYDSFIGKGENIVEMLVCWHFSAWHVCIPIFKNGELVSAESYAPLAGFEDIEIIGNIYDNTTLFKGDNK